MNQTQLKGLRALALLKEKQCTLDELSDKLCVTKRSTQKVIKHLKDSGFDIKSRTERRIKCFWTSCEDNFLPIVLTPCERAAIEKALTAQNPNLQTAIHKMTELVNIRLHIRLQQ
ncbi:HTH domain-containing protein [Fibrisoma limi]|uniref:HTH domain-containing protein n=1 Tax=Fibrisoma limi TaxID=663275 RepID=UPI0002F575E4|nr:HTH domain-containing protein [Fibrisoma limi]